MLKLIASDLDGTLLLHGAQKLNPEIYDLILELKKHGIIFVAASGRQIASLRHLFAPIADQISYIAENGSICLHDNKVISISSTNREEVLRVLNTIKERPGCTPIVSCVSSIYTLAEYEDFIDHMENVLHNKVTTVAKFEDIEEPFIKFAFRDLENNIQSAKHFKELFSDKFQVVTSGNGWVDLQTYDTNKGNALRKLLTELDIKPEECISFGDQQNDVEMLTLTGKSYAMAEAVPEAKAVADEIINSVEDTLRKILRELEQK